MAYIASNRLFAPHLQAMEDGILGIGGIRPYEISEIHTDSRHALRRDQGEGLSMGVESAQYRAPHVAQCVARLYIHPNKTFAAS